QLPVEATRFESAQALVLRLGFSALLANHDGTDPECEPKPDPHLGLIRRFPQHLLARLAGPLSIDRLLNRLPYLVACPKERHFDSPHNIAPSILLSPAVLSHDKTPQRNLYQLPQCVYQRLPYRWCNHAY